MMDFMRAGGITMWVMLIAAIATLGIAFTRPRAMRPTVLAGGAVVSIGLGLLGMAMGMAAVSSNYHRFPDKIAALGEGLGELSNNGSLAVALACVLGVVALVTRRQPSAAG